MLLFRFHYLNNPNFLLSIGADWDAAPAEARLLGSPSVIGPDIIPCGENGCGCGAAYKTRTKVFI